MIYFIKAGEYIKIGHTTVPVETRISQLQTGCPEKIELLFCVEGGLRFEKKLHRFYKKYHTHGEWFKMNPPTDDDIFEIRMLDEKIDVKVSAKMSHDFIMVISTLEAIADEPEYAYEGATTAYISELSGVPEKDVKRYINKLNGAFSHIILD